MYFLRESRSLETYQNSKGDSKISEKSNFEIEKLFWRTLKLNAPLYGADIAGTLMDRNVPWNLAELDTILSQGLGDTQLSGINFPYIYVGSWKTMFGWHKEDMDLYSINYLHMGASKFWYAIDVDDNEKFEKFVAETFPDKFEK